MANPSLTKYTGQWTSNEIVHLLKRTQFGATKSLIDKYGKMDMSSAIDSLMTKNDIKTVPLNAYSNSSYTDPTGVLFGETWVNAAYGDGTVNAKRRASLVAWWQGIMMAASNSIEDKMVFFWHNHFSTEISVTSDARLYYIYQNLIRKYALGNFKEFTKAITLDPTMLLYLNGNKNTVAAPDENYGRELQELFTIGKGANPSYSEDDVKAAARVLTGYQISDTVSVFNATRHDNKDKQFSSFYKNKVIAGKTGTAGATELDDLLTMIFDNDEAAKFICRKIYRYFVNYDITPAIETNIIVPLANVFRQNNYEIVPVLKTLLKSEHFFDTVIFGAIIKSPLDLTIGSIREFNGAYNNPNDLLAYFQTTYYFHTQALNMALELGEPPNVAGWPAYYQAPQYYENWVNTDTLPKRNQFTDSLVTGITRNTKSLTYDFLGFAKSLKNPEDPKLLLDQSLEILFRIPLSDQVKSEIKKSILLDGQETDYYWTNAWNDYLNTPTKANELVVSTKLKNLYKYLMELPEYQLM